jgi:hypothetical protein
LFIDGHELKLHAKRNRQVCRRIYCRDTTVIPAQTQQEIIVHMPFGNSNDGTGNILVDSTQLKPGVIMASAVLPCDETVTMVRFCNTNASDVSFNPGTPLAMAQALLFTKRRQPMRITVKKK